MNRKASRKTERKARKKSQPTAQAHTPQQESLSRQIALAAAEDTFTQRSSPKQFGALSCMEEKKVRDGWWCACILLAAFLHAVPVAFVLLGPRYGLPNVLELNLETMNLFRDRVFRETTDTQGSTPSVELQPVQIQAQIPKEVRPAPETRLARPEAEENLVRTRIVQKAIARLWENAAPEQAGYALVSLNVRDDGSIGEFVVNRFSGDETFRAFLFSFLATLKASYSNQAGPGESFWLECEFKVTPMERKGKS